MPVRGADTAPAPGSDAGGGKDLERSGSFCPLICKRGKGGPE